MRRIGKILTAVAVAGVSAATLAPMPAHADWKPGRHYMAFLAGSRTGVNSVMLVNTGTDGGTNCFDISSLTKAGPYTTKWVAYNYKSVKVVEFGTNDCSRNFVLETSTTPQPDRNKYWYFTIQ